MGPPILHRAPSTAPPPGKGAGPPVLRVTWPRAALWSDSGETPNGSTLTAKGLLQKPKPQASWGVCVSGLVPFPSNLPEPHLPDGLAQGTCGHHLADPLDISFLSSLLSHIPTARSFPLSLPDLPSCSSDVCSFFTDCAYALGVSRPWP